MILMGVRTCWTRGVAGKLTTADAYHLRILNGRPPVLALWWHFGCGRRTVIEHEARQLSTASFLLTSLESQFSILKL